MLPPAGGAPAGLEHGLDVELEHVGDRRQGDESRQVVAPFPGAVGLRRRRVGAELGLELVGDRLLRRYVRSSSTSASEQVREDVSAAAWHGSQDA
jgi:hypothetical protein